MNSKHTPPQESTNLDDSFNADDGLLTLQGSRVELRRRLDALFRHWATQVEAIEYSFPPVLSVASLDKADYFTSFPHLATLATRIESTEEGIKEVVDAAKEQELEVIEKKNLTPSRYALPSAACYAVYDHFKNMKLKGDLHVTLCSPCFRHETTYTAGQRQWMFHMREIVCVGQEESVQQFLQMYRDLIAKHLQAANIPYKLCEATDPFFDQRDPRRLRQRIEPLKQEFLYKDTLAISSANFHRDFFGQRFGIQDHTGKPAFSGCFAFGVERWLYACMQEFGPEWND